MFRRSLQQYRIALRDIRDSFPLIASEILQDLLVLFPLILFGGINDQSERNDFVFPLHMSVPFSRERDQFLKLPNFRVMLFRIPPLLQCRCVAGDHSAPPYNRS